MVGNSKWIEGEAVDFIKQKSASRNGCFHILMTMIGHYHGMVIFSYIPIQMEYLQLIVHPFVLIKMVERLSLYRGMQTNISHTHK